MSPILKLILVLFGLAYLISPVDLIPDLLLPFVGWLDDGLVLWCIYHLIRYGDMPWFLFKRPASRKTPSSRRFQGRPGRKQKGPGRTSQTKDTDAGPDRSGRTNASGNGAGSSKGNRSEGPDPREIIGVGPDAGWDEIQKAYKEKIKQYHPDKLSHLGEEFSSLANEKFLKIQEAYTHLKKEYRKE